MLEEGLNKDPFEGLLLYPDEDILMRVIAIPMIIGDIMMDKDPLEEENITIRVESHWIKGITTIEVILEEEGPLMMEDCLMIEDPMMMKDPLMMENHLMMEDPLGMEEIQDTLKDEDPQAHQDLLDQ